MNGKQFLVGLVLAQLVSATVATAADKTPVCRIDVKNAWIRTGPPGSMQLAGYAVLENPCAKAVTISSVTSRDFGMATMHQTVVEGGVSKMRQTTELTVPAKGNVVFAPGGRHLMLMMPVRPTKTGDTVSLTFGLTNGEKIAAAFPVLPQASGAGK